MGSIPVVDVLDQEVAKLLSIEEGHFSDIKSLRIAPAKLTVSIAALANAEGGELFVGVEENKRTRERSWLGFDSPEAANGHI